MQQNAPDLSQLTARLEDAHGYLDEYNRLYLKLGQQLNAAIKGLARRNPGLFSKPDFYLGSLELSLEPSVEVADPLTVRVNQERFYPEEIREYREIGLLYGPQRIKIPPSQSRSLTRGMRVMTGYSLSHWDRMGSGNPTTLNGRVNIQHRIYVLHGKPVEYINIDFCADGRENTPVGLYGIPFENMLTPGEIDNLENGVRPYVLNKALTLFDLTSSGQHIPIGLNRLALMQAVLNYLKSDQVRRPSAEVLTESTT